MLPKITSINPWNFSSSVLRKHSKTQLLPNQESFSMPFFLLPLFSIQASILPFPLQPSSCPLQTPKEHNLDHRLIHHLWINHLAATACKQLPSRHQANSLILGESKPMNIMPSKPKNQVGPVNDNLFIPLTGGPPSRLTYNLHWH